MNRQTKRNFYLVGIKGVAMTALAVYLHEQGHHVSGSDVTEEFSTGQILKKNGIKILEGFKAENITGNIDILISTGAHGGATNIEAVKAKSLKIGTFMHGEYLGEIMSSKTGIAVAGCHGKTTTSSIIAQLLTSAGLKPSYLIGTAYINGLGSGGHFGLGKYLVAEADEYMTCPNTNRKPRFLYLHPQIAVITNIDYDHPDEFKNLEEVKNAYLKFIAGLGENSRIIVCLDDPGIKSIYSKIKNRKVITYGFTKSADYSITDVLPKGDATVIKINNKQGDPGSLKVSIPGRHNLLNSLSAAVTGRLLGIPWENISEYIALFHGSNRRFELIKGFKRFLLYDDYAHHPSEIKATIEAARGRFPQRKLIIIFQPHTYSRTKMLLPQFASAFVEADKVFVVDIFASAREQTDPSITSELLSEKINAVKPNSGYIKDFSGIYDLLENELENNTVIITMGAGNLNRRHPELIKFLKNHDS